MNHSIFVHEPDIKVQPSMDMRDVKLEVVEAEEPLHLYFTNGVARAKVEQEEVQLTLDPLHTASNKYRKIFIGDDIHSFIHSDHNQEMPHQIEIESERSPPIRKNYQQFYKKIDGKLVCSSCSSQYDSTHGIHYHLNHTVCGFGEKERVAPKKDFRGLYTRDNNKFVCLGCSQRYETIRGVHYHLNNKKCGKISPDEFQDPLILSETVDSKTITSEASNTYINVPSNSKRNFPKRNYLQFYKKEGKLCICHGCGSKYQSIHGIHNHLNSTKCGFGEKFKSSPKTSYTQFYRKEEDQLICISCNVSYLSMHGMHYHLNSTKCGFGDKEGTTQKRNYQDFYTKEESSFICNHCNFKVEYLQGIHRHLRNCPGYSDFKEPDEDATIFESPSKVIKTIIYSENENMNYIGHDECL